jgi:hypothetical protein
VSRNDYKVYELARHGAGPPGPTGPQGPAGAAPTGTLAALTAPNKVVARLAGGLTVHDGTETSSLALLGGGLCVAGGAMGATVTYYGNGGLAPVGATGWAQGVPLYPNASGDLVPKGSLPGGVYSREMGTYDGANFSVGIGQPEGPF